MHRKTSLEFKSAESDTILFELLEKFPIKFKNAPDMIHEDRDLNSALKEDADHIINKIKEIVLSSRGNYIESKFAPINFIIQELFKKTPSFFIHLMSLCLGENKTNIYLLDYIFRLDCLSNSQLPGIHYYIQKNMTLEILQYYLPRQPSQLSVMIESHLLLNLLIKSQIKSSSTSHEPHQISHFFKLFALMSPDNCRVLINFINKKLPSSFSLPREFKCMLVEIENYLKNLLETQAEFNTNIRTQELRKEDSVLMSVDLISIFSALVHHNDKSLLDNYLTKITHYPPHLSIEILLLLFNAINKMSAGWPQQFLELAPLLATEKAIFVGIICMLLRIREAMMLWKADLLDENDLNDMKNLLTGIAQFNIRHIHQIFNMKYPQKDQPFSRKQYYFMCIVLNIITVIDEMIGEKKLSGARIDSSFFETLGIMKDKMYALCELPAFKLFAFENSEPYKKIRSQAIPFLETLFPEFEKDFFKNLHQSTPGFMDNFLEKIEDVAIQNKTMQLIVDISNILLQKKNQGVKKNIEAIKDYYLEKLDKIAYLSGLELTLEERDMRPVMLAQGFNPQSIDTFFTAFITRQFSRDEVFIANFKALAESKNRLMISYFISCLEYYRTINKEDPSLIKDLLRFFQHHLNQLKPTPESKLTNLKKKKASKPLIQKEEKSAQKHGPHRKKNPRLTKKDEDVSTLMSISEAIEDDIEPIRLFAITKRKIAIYQMYIELLKKLNIQFNSAKRKHLKSQNIQALQLDDERFNTAQTRLTKLLQQIIHKLTETISSFKEENKKKYEFLMKEETLAIQQHILSVDHKTVSECISIHNELVSALLHECHSNNKQFILEQESYLMTHINEFLLVPLTSMSLKQFSTIMWLTELVKNVENAALQLPSFEKIQRGFLQAGVYGNFIAKFFEHGIHSQAYAGDIDCAFYIDKTFTQNLSLTSFQMTQLQSLMQQHMPLEAQQQFKMIPKDIATWHGFSYHDQECDITLKESLPIPVVSLCCLFYKLKDNQVHFLENGGHALLHLKSNRLDIIAPIEQHGEPSIMAHVLKKVFAYIEQGAKLTRHSKIILGQLLSNQHIANMTITRFISSYGYRNPEYYLNKFSTVPLEVINDEHILETTLAEYMIRQSLRPYQHLNINMALAHLKQLNFKPFFESGYKQSLLLNHFFEFCNAEIRKLEEKPLCESIFPPNSPH